MVGDGISIKNVSYDNLGIIPYTFSRLGVQVLRHGDDLFIPRHDHYEIDSFLDGSFMTLSDAPWPGLTRIVECVARGGQHKPKVRC